MEREENEAMQVQSPTPLQQAMDAAEKPATGFEFGLRFAATPADDEPLIDENVPIVDLTKGTEPVYDDEPKPEEPSMWLFELTDAAIQPTGATMALREGGKLPYHLIPPEFNALIAAILEYGASKYAARNYEKGLPPEDLLRGAEAHLMAIKAGELHDPESGLPHAGHAAWNLLTFAMQIMRQPVIGYAYQQAMIKTRSGGTQELIQQLGEQFGLVDFTKPDLHAEAWTGMIADLRKGDGKASGPAKRTVTTPVWTEVSTKEATGENDDK